MYASTRTALATGIVAALLAFSATTASAAATPAPHTERLGTSPTGEQGNSYTYGPEFSGNGRFAVFSSDASNLVPGDTNGLRDVFVRDLRKGTVERVNVSSAGAQADDTSSSFEISPDGRYVLFTSQARNLVHGDTPPPADEWVDDVYLHDRRTGKTERLSLGIDGRSVDAGGAAMSADARWVAFTARPNRMEADDPNGYRMLYLLDRTTGKVKRVSERARPEWTSVLYDVSEDGSRIVYDQFQYRGPGSALWAYDIRSGTQQQLNVTPDGTPTTAMAVDASLTADGRYVAFSSGAPDLVPDDTNGTDPDVFVRDLVTGKIRRISHNAETAFGTQSPEISPDGRYLAYEATPRNRETGYFGVQNVYLRDLRTGQVRLVSESVGGGTVEDEAVTLYSVSRGGKEVGLASGSTQLMPDDTNGVTDGFVRHLR
ncbi:TolB family protein [Streptomyces sp. NPDC051913]|uniref:TolB family protein n=1 Tax=Streptomyces sp. NPDC051913 TaxID=3365676 RepID=UPI0037D98CE3